MAGKVSVFVTDTVPRQVKDVLDGFDVFESDASDDALARCRALMCWPSRAKAELVGKMKRLEMIQAMSAGVETLDFGSIPGQVRIFSNAGAYTDAVAEHAWGLLLGAAKGMQVRNRRTTPKSLRGKTLLVLGAGSIGSEVARLSKSLGMKTIGVSRSFRAPDMFDEKRSLHQLPEVIGEADAVVMALPLTKETRGVVGYDVLSKAKGAVVVVNVGRGDSVPEGDLIRWLKERPESSFATDVFWVDGGKERHDTEAWDLPNFAGTIHVSGVPLGEDLTAAKVAAARNVRLFFETGEALNPVDRRDYV